MICADRWWSMMMYDDAMMYDDVWQCLMMYDDLHRKDWWKKRLWFCCVARRWWKFRFWTPQISTESIEDFTIIWKKWHVMSNCFYLRNITACHIAITLCHVPANHIIMSYPYHRLMTWGSLGTYQGGLRWLQNVEGHMPRVTEPRRTEKPWLFSRWKKMTNVHEVKESCTELDCFCIMDGSLTVGNFLSEGFF